MVLCVFIMCQGSHSAESVNMETIWATQRHRNWCIPNYATMKNVCICLLSLVPVDSFGVCLFVPFIDFFFVQTQWYLQIYTQRIDMRRSTMIYMWCFCVIIFVNGIDKSVERRQEFSLNASREKKNNKGNWIKWRFLRILFGFLSLLLFKSIKSHF